MEGSSTDQRPTVFGNQEGLQHKGEQSQSRLQQSETVNKSGLEGKSNRQLAYGSGGKVLGSWWRPGLQEEKSGSKSKGKRDMGEGCTESSVGDFVNQKQFQLFRKVFAN